MLQGPFTQGGVRLHALRNNILLITTLLFYFPTLIQASIGDQLPAFQQCLATCLCTNIPPQYTVFGWSCDANCNYYCQQVITNERERLNLPMVQFYGKWPFRTVVGVQEFWSSLFSLGNLYANYGSYKVIYREFKRIKQSGGLEYGKGGLVDLECEVLYLQSLVLIGVSCMGWFCSCIFHFRDTGFTEVLDYFGAFAIMLCNLNLIVVRYFKLYKVRYRWRLKVWQLSLAGIYGYHMIRLFIDWDYSYNMNINVVAGLSAMALWFCHSFKVGKVYHKNANLINNTISLLPFEANILQKLHLQGNYYYGVTKAKKLRLTTGNLSRFIPYIPVLNNGILLCGLYLELNDFAPWQRLVDAHCLWHLITILPSHIWFDWNVWDIEMSKITGTL